MRRLQTKDPTLVQVLSLYLLLLAFFVVLFNASRYDVSRVAGVGESLTSTFKPTSGKPGDPRQNTSQLGQLAGGAVTLDSVAALVRTELEVSETEILRAGRLMRVRLPTNELFSPEQSSMSEQSQTFLDRFAAILGKQPVGLRHKVEISVGTDWVTPDQLEAAVPLAVARAAVFGETLLAKGALAGTVMSGVAFEAPAETVLLFRIDPEVRPEDSEPQPKPEPEAGPGQSTGDKQ